MANTSFRSQVSRIEEKQNLKKAYFLIGVTIIIVGSLALFGIPLMIKAATLIEEIRGSNETIVKSDQIPPQTPVLEPYSTYTNSRDIDLYGSTEAGVAVIVRVNDDNSIETVSDANGKFSFTIDLSDGENQIKIIAKDVAGNESEAKTISLFFDDKPPEIELTNPTETNVTTEESKIDVAGKTESNAQVYLNDRRVIVGREGDFQSQYYLQEGENKISVLARDRAGNETRLEITVNYERF